MPVQALKRALDTNLAQQPTGALREAAPDQAASADDTVAADMAAEVAAEEEPDEDLTAAVLQLQQPWDNLVSAVQAGEEFKVGIHASSAQSCSS